MQLSIMTVSPVSPKETERNLNNAKRLGFPRMGKAETTKLAVVGGGPSIESRIDELKAFDGDIWAINGAFQWCKDRGIGGSNLWFFSVDPSEMVADFCKGAKRAMVAMDSHPKVFRALSSAKVEAIDITDLPHGPSSSTSAPTMGLLRGYTQFYFYGCEGSFEEGPDGKTHAYGNYGLDMLLRVRCNGQMFLTTADMQVQVEHLGDLMIVPPDQFENKEVRFIDKSGGLLSAYVNAPDEDARIIHVEEVAQGMYDAIVKSHAEKAGREAELTDTTLYPLKEKPRGILIAMPAYGQMNTTATTQALFTTAQFLTAQKIPNHLMTLSAADIEDIRNLFVSQWYDAEPDFSHLLFVDADMGFSPELIRDMIQWDRPLCGVLYARREMPASIVGTAPEGHSIQSVHHGFIQSTGIGAGVMLIKREVITRMLEKFPELVDDGGDYMLKKTDGRLKRMLRVFDKIRTPKLRLSEDMAFCHRWQECGGEIWANINHKISHVGPFDYHMRYAGILEEKAKEVLREAA